MSSGQASERAATGASPAAGTNVLLVVPQGSYAIEPLAAALRLHHPHWPISAVWCGDPQLRPYAPANVRWAELAHAGHAWERELVGSKPPHVEWRKALASTRSAIAGGVERVVLLWVGSIGVLGPIGELACGTGLTVVPHVLGELDLDGLAPSESDLLDAGPFSAGAAAFGRDAIPIIDWLMPRLADPAVSVGRWLGRAGEIFGVIRVESDAIGAGPWRWPVGDVRLLDVPGFDVDQPWMVDAGVVGAARITIADEPERRAALDAAATQLTGRRTPLRLPGGLVVDATIRTLVADSIDVAPAPWSEPVAFRRWLAPRYWPALRTSRSDLAATFPGPSGAHSPAFCRWTSSAFAVDDVPLLVEPATPRARLHIDAPLATDGLNLVGYHALDFSLGDVMRRLAEVARAADIPFTTIAATRSASPPLPGARPTDQRVAYTTTLAVVTADQLPLLQTDHPELFAATERMIGYWFWELEHVPRAMRQSIAAVDEIWTGSRFVAEAFAAVSRVPVHHVPIPVPMPEASDLGRSDFPMLATIGSRAMFLVAFDHFSITERKNPIGAIEAFRTAFAPDEGPVLVVKSMNASGRWAQHQKVVAAAWGRADIVVWDEHLGRADQMALVASADCLVSLHRAEGLGLHLAEAMWLGTPTIATRYSGNLDFMDDECSLLIDAGRVHVTDGQGIYPVTAMWADPDIEQAAAAMRRIASDPTFAQRLADDARARMVMQPSLADTGRLIRRMLHGGD